MVIGGGLIGGSICLGLRAARPRVEIVCLDLPERVDAIASAGVADVVTTVDRATACLARSALVILAVPVNAIPAELERIAPHLRAGTVVTDVGSTKHGVMAQVATLVPAGVSFVGGHPVAGAARSGVDAADPAIFEGRAWVLCPYPDTPIAALRAVRAVARDLRATPVVLDPLEHDRRLAVTSHAPQLLATALMHAAIEAEGGAGWLELLVGPAFEDMTRVAASDLAVWQGILATNAAQIRSALAAVRRGVDDLLAALDAGEGGTIWNRAAARRRRLGRGGGGGARRVELRARIDACDERLLAALAERMRVARAIGELKAEQGLPVLDPERERRLRAQRREWGRSLALPVELVEDVFARIVAHSRQVQEEVRGPTSRARRSPPGRRPRARRRVDR